jgi:hypothetical protein
MILDKFKSEFGNKDCTFSKVFDEIKSKIFYLKDFGLICDNHKVEINTGIDIMVFPQNNPSFCLPCDFDIAIESSFSDTHTIIRLLNFTYDFELRFYTDIPLHKSLRYLIQHGNYVPKYCPLFNYIDIHKFNLHIEIISLKEYSDLCEAIISTNYQDFNTNYTYSQISNIFKKSKYWRYKDKVDQLKRYNILKKKQYIDPMSICNDYKHKFHDVYDGNKEKTRYNLVKLMGDINVNK